MVDQWLDLHVARLSGEVDALRFIVESNDTYTHRHIDTYIDTYRHTHTHTERDIERDRERERDKHTYTYTYVGAHIDTHTHKRIVVIWQSL